VVNGDSNSVTIIHSATGGANFRIEPRRDRDHAHFMPAPTGIAFGADQTNDAAINAALVPGTFATCQDSRNGGNDFMGPVLWSSDLSVFAVRNGMLGSHLDMLHQSPQCMGIAWEGAGNVFWTFDGLSGSISRYDFQLDHGVGNDDHTDGKIWRYVRGEVKAVANVVSHLVYRAEDRMVYAADTGNARVVKLAATSGTPAGAIVPRQDEAEGWNMTGATLSEVVPRSAGMFTAPSGLEIHEGHLYVSDNATGIIHKLKLDGARVAQMQTDAQPGGLGGMAFGPDKHLYFTDQVSHRVARIDSAF
jgi:DNA-binding beta-propeller fold protein YncE